MPDKEVLKIQVELDGLLHTIDLDKDLAITEETLNDDMMEQPGHFARAGVLQAAARYRRKTLEAKRSELKAHTKEVVAEAAEVLRADLEAKGEKVTESRIDREHVLQLCYKEHMERLNALEYEIVDAFYDEDILAVAVQSFEHRKDMLVSVGAQFRAGYAQDVKTLRDGAERKMAKATEAKRRRRRPS